MLHYRLSSTASIKEPSKTQTETKWNWENHKPEAFASTAEHQSWLELQENTTMVLIQYNTIQLSFDIALLTLNTV